jgi:hypothetical protein
MKKLTFLVIAGALLGAGLFAQASIADSDPNMYEQDTGVQTLDDTAIDLFEREGAWTASISPDDGFITSTSFEGGPNAKAPPPEVGDQPAPTDTKILGVKVEFYHRGVNSFYVRPLRPLPVKGTAKTVSVWVAGRNLPHKLVLVVQDYNGRTFDLPMGTLDFSGWKRLSVVIPPSPDGIIGIVQSNPYYGERPGIRIAGFRVDCDPATARGTYYIYFDGLTTVADQYNYDSRDTDDPDDSAWNR